MDEVVAEFVVESHENIDLLDRSLLALESNPADGDTLRAVFRSIHTIKGASGFLGFDHLTALTHAAESVLAGLRDGTRSLTPDTIAALFATVDAVRTMLRTIDEHGHDGHDDHGALIDRLRRLEDPEPAGPPAPPLPDPVATTPPAPAALDAAPAPAPAAPAPAPAASEAGGTGGAASTIRVGVGLLDKLMNLVGELVLARNQLLQCTAGSPDPTFTATAQRLDLITTELQEGVMKTRMQPIGTIWNKLPRVVRDLSMACGKQVRVEMEGAGTELDRTLIEAMTDPLNHLVRNAVDHGFEPPRSRMAAGKPAQGRLALRAFHEGGHVNIEVSDDGAGIDIGRVREKARAHGLLRGGVEGRMSEREMLGLIFSPGLSTAPTVSDISGRGVGLDVVRTNIERIGGTIDVVSTKGVGTTFRIKIPLTLAIIPALIVTTGAHRYAIPQVNLVELVRVDDSPGAPAIEYVHGVPVLRRRGHLLPLVDLAGQLGLRKGVDDRLGGGPVSIVVLQAADRQFGLVVDDICDTEEIVVKPLGPQIKQIETFAGATIMGDGRVALILDVTGLAQRAGVLDEESERVDPDAGAGTDSGDQTAPTEPLLVVGVGDRRRMAIHLCDVSRLEEFDGSDVELAGSEEVVQYQGRILPLVRLRSLIEETTPGAPPERLQVVVHDRGPERVGLVVDRVLDIVDEPLRLDAARPRPGLLGSAIVQGRVTDVIDVAALVAAVTGPTTSLVGAA